MITLRPAADRFHTQIGWLDSWHTFSFGEHYDPAHMGFRALRVINDDRVAPAAGFPTHPHRDMEIISYVLDGAIAHQDSLGNGSVIKPGEVQRMTAGTGVRHSEHNPSRTEAVHFLQIWLLPERPGLTPGYEQKPIPTADDGGPLRLVGAAPGGGGAVTIHQDVRLYAGRLTPGQGARVSLAPGRHAWVQVARGSVVLNDRSLGEGDGAAVTDETSLQLVASESAEVLVFDLA